MNESYFDNDYRMFIPLTIDDMETEKTSYFLTGPKLVILLVSVMPYFLIFFALDYIPDVRIFIIYTVLYLIIYQYIARYFVFEEKTQRLRMESLEKNKQSGVDYFWELERVGNRKTDDGMLYIQSNGITLRRGYIVAVDSGSTVGVPQGNYREFRKTIQEFFRYMSKYKLDVRVYNIQKNPELAPSLKKYAGMLRGIGDKDALVKLMQLQIDINFVYSVSLDQRYVTYYVITNKSIANLRNFRNMIQDAIDHTFKSNSSFADTRILSKLEVDGFLANYYMQDALDSDGIHKMNGFKEFDEFCELVTIIDSDGNEVPIDLLDEFNEPLVESIYLDDLVDKSEKDVIALEKRRVKKLEQGEQSLIKRRRADELTHEEYLKELSELKENLSVENYSEEFEDFEEERKKAEKELERNRKREEKKKERLGLTSESDEKWYETGDQEVIHLKSEKTYVKNDYILDLDDDEDDYDLDDLL